MRLSLFVIPVLITSCIVVAPGDNRSGFLANGLYYRYELLGAMNRQLAVTSVTGSKVGIKRPGVASQLPVITVGLWNLTHSPLRVNAHVQWFAEDGRKLGGVVADVPQMLFLDAKDRHSLRLIATSPDARRAELSFSPQ